MRELAIHYRLDRDREQALVRVSYRKGEGAQPQEREVQFNYRFVRYILDGSEFSNNVIDEDVSDPEHYDKQMSLMRHLIRS